MSLPRRFGAYELLEEIGSGGMGIVYRARQEGLNRTVALKLMLSGQSARRPDFVERFHREAEAAASLRHPNIVAIHEFGEHSGQPFFSMDLVEGQTLADLASQGPLPAHRAVNYVKAIAEAVAYAHNQGILHRDLKPANVLIDSSDQARILDFGLAKRLDDESDLTRSGALLGSPSYMPPEQLAARRGEIGPASDVYSIGAILYHLLTGRPPFVAADIERTLLEVLDSEPLAPRLLNPSVPIDLESVCLKCLEKEPARRYASAKELVDDLTRFSLGEPTLARPVSRTDKLWRWCKRKPALAGLTLLSVLSLAGVAVVTTIASVRLARKEAIVRQNSYVADMHLAAQAIEGNSLGHAKALLGKWRPARKGDADLRGWEWRYFWNQCQGEELFILGSHESSVLCFAFSPDGKRMASGSIHGEVKLWDLEARREIGSGHHRARVNALTFSADGQRLVSGGGDKLVRFWDVHDMQNIGEPLRHSDLVAAVAFSPGVSQLFTAAFDSFATWDVTTHKKLNQYSLSCWQRAAISPDCQLVAVAKPNGTVELWSVSSHSTVAVLSGHTDMMLPVAFSPDGTLVASGSFDSTAGVWEVSSRRHLTNLSGHKATVGAVAFSPDGHKLATASNDQTLRLWDTRSWRQLPGQREHHSAIWSVVFTPEGNRVVTGGKDGTIKFWNADSARGPVTSLEIPPHFSHGPFSADGRRMLTSDANHQWSVWELDHSPRPRSLPLMGERAIFAHLAADPYALVVNSNGVTTVWNQTGTDKIMTLSGPAPSNISRDGKFLARTHDSRYVIHDIPAKEDVLALELTTNVWYHAEFAPDSRLVVVCSHEGPLLFWDLIERRAPSMARGHKLRVGAMCFSPDGSLVASAASDGTVKLWNPQTYRELATLESGADAFWSVTISPDNRRVAAGSGEGAVVLWDCITHEHLATFKGHASGIVGTVAFTPDGNALISAAKDAVRFWRATPLSEADSSQ